MTENVTRRRVLRSIGAGAVVTGTAGEALADPPGEGGSGVDRSIVGLEPDADFAVARKRATSVHRQMDFERIGKAVAGTFPEPALKGLRNHPDVRYVEPDGEVRALAQTLPWGVDRVDADVLHSNGETGNGADVAIIDTGIDSDHPDLQANVGAGKAYVNCDGSNGATCNYDWDDDNDHGTHCAGIADAVDNTEGVVGVSTEATLHAVKVLDSGGSGSFSDVAAGIEYVADQGWDVASMSLGGSSGTTTLKDACQYAYDKGVLLVAAVGNSGPCSDCVGYPAAYSTVMAISSTAKDDTLSDFSSTGPEVELAAPGSNVYSTVIGGYDTFSGTSMACPHVSGAGGQLMANGYTNKEARSQLKNTAEDIGLGDNESGAGLLDAETAVLGAGFSVSTDQPTNVDGSSATLNGTLDNLDGASSADVYFEWRQTGASSWNTTSTQTLSSTGSFSANVSGLSEGAEYEYRAVGAASDNDTDTGSTVTFVASVCADASRWPSGSGVSGYEQITQVDMDGQVVKSSSDNAYYDFTCPDVVTVQQGGSFTIALDFDDGGYDGHYGNVYVDWGGEGDWSTATETRIMADVNDDTTTYTATVDVPSDAATGATLARVRLSWSQFYGPSATDEYGEVDDFTILVEEPSGGLNYESGSVTTDQPDGTTWHSVSTNSSYSDPVVVMGPPTHNGGQPATMRVRGIGSSGFEYQIDEWEYLDGGHTTEDIGYAVFESGTGTLGGATAEAGYTQTDETWTKVSFDAAFDSAPVVVAQCSSYEGGDPVTTRVRNVSAGGFEVRLQEEEGGDGGHVVERVDFLAVAPVDASGVEAGTTGNEVTDATTSVSLDGFDTAPNVLASMQTFDGGNTAALRLASRSASGFDVFVEEEASGDDETSHTTEVVGYVALS